MIAAALEKIANDVCRAHYGGLTQEAPLTARIGQALEGKVKDIDLKEYCIRVITSDIPDRGRGSLESKLGADLYVGVEVAAGGIKQSKGFLVQAKWSTAVRPGDIEKLNNQCQTMLERSKDSYVWVYGSTGVRVIPAERIVKGPRIKRFGGGQLKDLFGRVLECTAGDRTLGIPSKGNSRRRVEAILKELNVSNGIGIIIKQNQAVQT